MVVQNSFCVQTIEIKSDPDLLMMFSGAQIANNTNVLFSEFVRVVGIIFSLNHSESFHSLTHSIGTYYVVFVE